MPDILQDVRTGKTTARKNPDKATRSAPAPATDDPPAATAPAGNPAPDTRAGGAALGTAPKPRGAGKQAVVLVHGMGEQVPMETLRGFVEQMWVRDGSLDARRTGEPDNPVWWKPDSRANSLELSRITTRSIDDQTDKPRLRTDFHEFYWADLTDANTLDQLKDWFAALLLRHWWQVPRDVFAAWSILWAVTIAVAVLFLWKAADKFGWTHAPSWVLTAVVVLGVLYGLFVKSALKTFGDVARYVRAKPSNIAARREIRQRGLALLNAIDADGYERVVLVGHSLGSIVAYDLLRFLWSGREAMRTTQRNSGLHGALEACRIAGDALTIEGSPEAIDAYRARQHDVFQALTRDAEEPPWLISDFVTIGSPLAHAQFLIERDKQRFDRAKDERRYPTSPPVKEMEQGFVFGMPDGKVRAHHAAVFAAVRWTNVYDPCRAILFGDFIGGPVQGNFGPGIRDVPVRIEDTYSVGLSRFFTHTKYWSDANSRNPHLAILRRALALRP